MKQLEFKVFPSEEKTIFVEDDPIYGGAHKYKFIPSVGFNNGVAEYVHRERENGPVYPGDYDATHEIQFVQKNDDETMIPGAQSEQLAFILLDRAVKLNNRFPSAHNEKMITGLKMFIEACEERVQERLDRGVMGKLAK